MLNRSLWYWLAASVFTTLWLPPAVALDVKLDMPLVVERAALAARHMSASETPGGGFVYEHDFAANAATERDNIVRQAGAGFTLAQYLAHALDLSHAPRVERALGYYGRRSLPFERGRLVASEGELDGASSGATALAMLAELFYFEATGDDGFAALRGEWFRGLQALWLPEGGFAIGPGHDESSPYFDGEAWLALAHYARLIGGDGDASALLEKADRHFLSHYAKAPDIGFMHWGQMAAAIRHQTTGDPIFLTYSVTLADTLLSDFVPEMSPDSNACYLVEGLAAAASELEGVPAHSVLLARIARRIEAELEKSLQFQILPDQTQIDLAPGRFLYDEALYQQAGAFLNDRYALRSRVDFTQHCLSALMLYEDWQNERKW